MIKPMLSFLFFIFIIASMLLGCGKLTITSSTLKIDVSDLEKIKAIVDASFLELGFRDESGAKCPEKRCSYGKGEDDIEGFFFYDFRVTYKMTNGQIIVHIESKEISASELRLKTVNKHLTKLTELIKKRLQEANLKATVESKSYWVPNPYK